MWTKTYSISPEQEAVVLAKLKEAGITVDPTKPGSATEHGIDLTWTAIENGQITMTASGNPFHTVEHRLDALLG